MDSPKIAVVFFSGTNVTKEYAEVIRAELARRGDDARLVDVTAFAARERPLGIEDCDAFLFGMPVYADFVPSVMAEWIQTLRGEGKPCAVFVTYGGRASGHAHYHMNSMLTAAGFQVRLSAEFLGRHTFNLAGWNLMAGRPNEADLAVAREFAALARKRFEPGYAEGFSLSKPAGYDHALKDWKNPPPSPERKWTQPVRVKDCSLCGLCEAECPTQAMDMHKGESDPAKCIECLHCMVVCPEKALQTDDRMREFFPTFLEDCGLTEEILNHKRSRIIAAGWPAATRRRQQ